MAGAKSKIFFQNLQPTITTEIKKPRITTYRYQELASQQSPVLANIIIHNPPTRCDRQMNMIDIMSIVIIIFSLGVFYWFGRFTQNLIKQHYNINGLLYDLEVADKKKKR